MSLRRRTTARGGVARAARRSGPRRWGRARASRRRCVRLARDRLVRGRRRGAAPPATWASTTRLPLGSIRAATDARERRRHILLLATSVYSDPRVYELAFGFRDFDAEIAFVRAACERLGTGRLDAFLELGAGPAWHSVACGQNIPGARAVAVDNSPPCWRARASARLREPRIHRRRRRGRHGPLDVDALRAAADAPDGFDAACILLGTAAHLVDTDDAVACLRGAADALRPGGVVILELEHPFDIFDGQLMDAQGDAWDREVDGVKILVEWGREGDYFDVATHVVERTVGFNVVDPVLQRARRRSTP